MTEQRYSSPAAFRRALADRLRGLEKKSRWRVPQLQRQFAYDRLLQRLYRVDRDWIVKGAVALLARDLGVRGTIDIDVYRDMARDAAEADLRDAAAADLGDWFRFEVGPGQAVGDGAPGIRLPVKAYIGATEWVSFHVDLVGSELRMTGEPEDVRPLAELAMPDVDQGEYRAYPLVDHIADKIAATFQRYGVSHAPSTRYKDLVDLVVLVSHVSVGAGAQLVALVSETERRGITLPRRFEVPDRRLWERGYAAEARRSLLDTGKILDDALAIVTPFADRLLDGTARGSWDPDDRAWRE
jgi:hypothetical protein